MIELLQQQLDMRIEDGKIIDASKSIVNIEIMTISLRV